MLFYWLSAMLVVTSAVAYHCCQKLIPSEANPMLSVFVTFVAAAVATLLILPFWMGSDSLHAEIRKLNWASAVLGIVIIGVDVGYLLLYRSGWNVSLGSVFCNAWVAILLVPVGVAFFKERLVPSNYAGIVLAMVGIYLMSRR